MAEAISPFPCTGSDSRNADSRRRCGIFSLTSIRSSKHHLLIIQSVHRALPAASELANYAGIDDILDLLAVVLADLSGRSRSNHHDQALLWITEKLCSVSAGPGELTWIAWNGRETLAYAYSHSEPEPKAGTVRLHISDLVFDLWPKVVGDHVMHRPGTENALAIEFPAV